MQFKRIYIKNFQSIKELEVVLEENKCYHIRGNNNIGKSSFLKALEAIVKNISSRNVKNFIRDEEDSFYVEISDFDNNVVRLSRGKEDYYSWDISGDSGRVDNTAGKVPDEVRAFFNMYEDIEKTKEIVNIRPPRAKLLFVDTTFGENYYLLQKALRIEEYLSAIKLGNSKKTLYRNEIKASLERIEDEKEDLKTLKDYSIVLNEIKTYEDSFEGYFNSIENIQEVLDLSKSVNLREEKLNEKTFDYDREYVQDLVAKLKSMKEILDLSKSIEKRETSISNKEVILEEFTNSLSIYKNLKDMVDNKNLFDEITALSTKVDKAEEYVLQNDVLIKNWESSDLKNKVEIIMSSIGIVEEGKKVRARIESIQTLELDYNKEETLRKEFMLEYKFCPVVLSMKDKKCPFSNKTLLELLV